MPRIALRHIPNVGSLAGTLLSLGGLVACSNTEQKQSAPAAQEGSSAAPTVVPGGEHADATSSAPKPSIGADGFPTGQNSPEGAACDLARAFVRADSAQFRSACVPLKRGSSSGDAYNNFLDQVGAQMDRMQGQELSQFGGPKEILRVYQARRLSRSGPASFGFAVMNLDEVMFVDVETTMWDGSVTLTRTLVVRAEGNQRWYAMPRPDLYPLLSDGLNEETDSTDLWQR